MMAGGTNFDQSDPNRRRRYRPVLVGIGLMALAVPGAGGPAEAAPPPASARQDTATSADAPIDDEVIVTARRRAERSQDVPLPITVLGGDSLESSGLTRLDDIQQKLPSTTANFFNPRQASISIRGIGLNPAADTLDNSVGVFLDGVYLGRPGMSVTDLIDLDRFELLRGPQGTLFGKNTTAGAINITTKAPSFTPEVKAETSLGTYSLREVKASASGGIVDNLVAARLSGYSSQRDGFLDNIHGGTNNDADRQGLRGQVLVTPNTDVKLRLSVDYAKTDERCCVAVVANQGPNGAALANRYATVGYKSLSDPFSYTTDVDRAQRIRTTQGGVSAEANWTVDDYTLTSITAYRFWKFLPQNDFDFIGAQVTTQSGARTDDAQVTQELRIASPSGQRVEWVAGAYYFHQILNDQLITSYGKDAAAIFAGSSLVPSSWLNGFASITDTKVLTDSIALFGQGTAHIDDQWAVTLGLRNTYERKEAQSNSYANLPINNALRTALGPVFTANTSVVDNAPTWHLSPSYKVNDNVLTYALYSRGFKSAALNTTKPLDGYSLKVQPEKIDNIELGTKTTWFDRKLVLNVNAFLGLVSNYQSNLVNYNTNQSFLANVGFIRTRGFELDSSLRVAPGLKLTFSGSYNDAIYRSFANAPCPAEVSLSATCRINRSGQRAAQAPVWIGALGAEYSHPIWDGFEGYIQGDYSYKSGFYGSIDESRYTWIDGHGITNLRVGTRLEDESVDVSLWAKNVFDTHYYTTIFKSIVSGGSYVGSLGDPLTIGGTVRVKF